MDAKKAIEYLTLTKIESRGYEGKNYDEIIELIEELGKYKQMWEELISLMKAGEIYTLLPGDISDKGLRIDGIRRAIEFMQEKYFPKPFKETVTDNIFIQVIELIKRCYMSGMQMDFLLEQVIELRKQHKENQCQTTP